MPNYAHHTFEWGGIAIWHITETSDELYALLDTEKYDSQLLGMKNEVRRAEWLAVRLLVKELFGSEAEVAYHPTGRPYLKNSTTHISISHTKGFAAVAYHHEAPVGMDIEYLSSRVERIALRFTTRDEASYIDRHDESVRQMYHLINWSAKETLYKLFDSPSMAEFKEVFHIAPYALAECGTMNATVCNAEKTLLAVSYRTFPEFVCTWAVASATVKD
jgi:phosphopantetheinyl transferase